MLYVLFTFSTFFCLNLKLKRLQSVVLLRLRLFLCNLLLDFFRHRGRTKVLETAVFELLMLELEQSCGGLNNFSVILSTVILITNKLYLISLRRGGQPFQETGTQGWFLLVSLFFFRLSFKY